MRYLFFILALTISLPAQAQIFDELNLFMVSLTDKGETPYSVFHPEDFLAPRSIERRKAQNISLDERDLPVDPAYVEQIAACGVDIHLRSKWLNAVVVYTTDTSTLDKIRQLPFVVDIEVLGKRRKVQEGNFFSHFEQEDYDKRDNYYGVAANQIYMLSGQHIHSLGFRGQKKHVAIFDGGFINVYRMPAFDSLFANDRILGTHDFVQGDEYVYEGSSHGTNVLSCMAANLPYLVMGTAPDAAYYLFKTEDVGGEYRIEEFNWVCAAERADSLGVDVVNSSLGYTHFNEKSMNYSYEDMDGETAICTRGADIAVEKGMLIVNSAGNEGSGKWHYVGAPADGNNVISVGAVRPNGKRASFSSYGPTPDGRVKPNVAAQGRLAAIAGFRGYSVATTDGTSFSSPIMAGMVTTLWSAFPDKTNWEIKDAIEAAGHQTVEPDSSLGYGIPDFLRAYLQLMDAGIVVSANGQFFVSKTVVDDQLLLVFESKEKQKVRLTLMNELEQTVLTKSFSMQKDDIQLLELSEVGELPHGLYTLEIKINESRFYTEVVKNYSSLTRQ